MAHAEGLRIAVMINIEGASNTVPMKAAFEKMLTKVSPGGTVDFFDPVLVQEYPDVSKYDLIVLSGGNVFAADEIPWVMKMRSFIKSTLETHPKQKIMGICWGHQIINVALGGEVREMGFADMGVHSISLTPEGSAFFGDKTLLNPEKINIQQFHKRDVKTPAAGLIPLAANNEAFINAENTVITFQGHPEMTVEWASGSASDYPAYVALTGHSMEAVQESIRLPADGEAIWRRVLDWVKE